MIAGWWDCCWLRACVTIYSPGPFAQRCCVSGSGRRGLTWMLTSTRGEADAGNVHWKHCSMRWCCQTPQIVLEKQKSLCPRLSTIRGDRLSKSSGGETPGTVIRTKSGEGSLETKRKAFLLNPPGPRKAAFLDGQQQPERVGLPTPTEFRN